MKLGSQYSANASNSAYFETALPGIKMNEFIQICVLGTTMSLSIIGIIFFLLSVSSDGAQLTSASLVLMGAAILAAALLGLTAFLIRYFTAIASFSKAGALTNIVESENEESDLASLIELDDLLAEQDPYFRRQLAIALREKALHFPISVGDVQSIRAMLEDNDESSIPALNAQVYHLTKIIESLD